MTYSESNKVGVWASFSVSVLMGAMVVYMVVFTGDSSRGWFLYLLVCWPPLAGYWMVRLYHWAVSKTIGADKDPVHT